jgi:hypothetical protein
MARDLRRGEEMDEEEDGLLADLSLDVMRPMICYSDSTVSWVDWVRAMETYAERVHAAEEFAELYGDPVVCA